MKALLIIDIQNDYFKNGAMTLSGALEASEKAKKVIEKFRTEKLPVIHIQHIAAIPEAGFFLPNTLGAEIHENVQPIEGEKIIIKHYPNSFRETDLQEYLKQLNITELVICGMMTHMCIDATTRAAKDLGYECTLIGNACAAKDLEILNERVSAKEVHYSFLAALHGFYANVITLEVYLM